MQVSRYVKRCDEILSPWVNNYLYAEIEVGERMAIRQISARPIQFFQFIIEGTNHLRSLGGGQLRQVPSVAYFGPYSHRVDEMVLTGKLRTFSVRLLPSAGHLLFGLDMAICVNGFFAPFSGDRVIERLREAENPEAMVSIVEDWLRPFCLTALPKDRVAHAADRLFEDNGAVEIAILAKEAGVSERQFQRIFIKQVGFQPKTYARLCRLSHAISMHERFPKMGWSEIAYSCGYSDQSHLARDFRELQHESPTQFRRYQWLADRDAQAIMSDLF
jgi:AraC-like DNA-binding protein